MSTEPALLPPDEDVSDIVDLVRRFGADQIDARAIDRDHRIPADLLTELADLGLFGLSVPHAYGGLGLSLAPICEVISALAESDRSVATTVGLHLGLGTRGLIAFADEETKAVVLPKIATGEHIAAFAATEPAAGSDLRSVATKALPSGDGLVVNGQKIFVTNGGLAKTFTILAATPGLNGRRKGYSLLWLDRDDQGLEVGPEEDKLGLRGSSTTSLHLDDMRLPMDRIIGEPGYGIDHINHVLAWGRTAMASGCVGAARVALNKATRHVQERVQFGKTLASQPVVRTQLADLASLHFAMQSMVSHTATSPTAALLERRSLATKVVCSEGNWEICDRAIQLHGGSGYIEETGMPLLLRDARITRIFEGANDVLISLIGTLEATSAFEPWTARGPGSPRAEALHRLLQARHHHLTKTHKLKLLRKPTLLAQLGHLGVIRQSMHCVVQAAASDPSPIAAELAEHWISRCVRAASPHLTDPEDTVRIGRIADFCAQEVHP